jgi:hypothetical protein
MSVTHTIVRSAVKAPTVAGLQVIEPVVGDFENNVSILIPAQSGSPVTGANFQVNWSCTRSKLQSFVVQSSRPCTIYTNSPSSGSPQDTIPLVNVMDSLGNSTGQVLVWTLQADQIGRCPFAGNVTTMYVTPPIGGDPVLFQILAIVNN